MVDLKLFKRKKYTTSVATIVDRGRKSLREF